MRVKYLVLSFALLALSLGYLLVPLSLRQDMVLMLMGLVATYGILAVFISALLKGIVGVGWYFPGGLVVILAIIASGNDFLQIFFIVIAATIGFVIGYTLDYFLGAYGLYKLVANTRFETSLSSMRAKLEGKHLPVFFVSLIHPSAGVVLATLSGILRLPFGRFFAYIVSFAFFWSIFWAVVSFFLGSIVVQFSFLLFPAVLLLTLSTIGFIYFGHKKISTRVPLEENVRA